MSKGKGMPRPDMREYFRARIDQHVKGMLSTASATAPRNVRRVIGQVTGQITVEMLDGTRWHWVGGGYASRKVNGCYAPLMPKPVSDPTPEGFGA